MKIKVTYPIRIDDRVYMPGETIDVPEPQAHEYIDNEWAAEVAEDKPKRKVKNGDR